MSVVAPETLARQAIKEALQAEFATEGFPVLDDKLHPSVGGDGKTRIATSPLSSAPLASNKMVLVVLVLVQFYGKWKKEINNLERVDPARIEEYAERARRAIRGADPKLDAVWYFDLRDTSYPDDPTGNRTRFEMRIAAIGNNSALVL